MPQQHPSSDERLQLDDDPRFNELARMAREKIFAGIATVEVKEWLAGYHLPEERCSRMIEHFLHQRINRIRRMGKNDMLLGVVLLAFGASSAGFLIYYIRDNGWSSSFGRDRFGSWLVAASLMATSIGFSRLARGIRWNFHSEAIADPIPDEAIFFGP